MGALSAYLKMRARLLSRQVREVGWWRLAVLGPVLLVMAGRGLVLAATHAPWQWAVPGAVGLLLASAHRRRADLRFLATSAPGHRRWVAAEYALWAVPAAVGLLLLGQWPAAGLIVAVAPLAAATPVPREARSTHQHRPSVFRSEAFEWVSGVRAGGALVWLGLLAAALWQHASPLGPVLALGGWLLAVLACYGVPEPATMVALAARSPRQFLWRRLALGLGYATLSGAPLLWLLACGPAGVGGAMAVGLAWLGLVGLIILTKYAFYPNALHIRTTQALVVGVALVLPGHPVYPVLLLVAVGGLIWQSHRRLQTVLGGTEVGISSS